MDDALAFLKAADTPIALGTTLLVLFWILRDRKNDRRMIISNQKALIGLLEQTIGGQRALRKEDSDEPKQESKT